MCFDVNSKNEQDIENMFLAFVKQVIVQSRKKFDKSCRVRLQHEELTLTGEIQDLITNCDNEIENPTFIEECNELNSNNIEFIFTDEKLYMSAKSLKAKQKKVLYLIFVKEKSELEIANILNLTRQDINYIKHTAIKEILKTYSDQT